MSIRDIWEDDPDRFTREENQWLVDNGLITLCEWEFGPHEDHNDCDRMMAEMGGDVYDPGPYDNPYHDDWERGYLPGSGENMYDSSYINYLNSY